MNHLILHRSVILILALLTYGCSSDNSKDPDQGIMMLNSTAVDAAVENFLDTGKVPGVAVATVSLKSSSPTILAKGYGVTEVGTTTPVDANTSFWLGSVSKSFVGTLMMMGQEEGLFNIDDDIRANVSSLGGLSIDDPANREISMRSLASHTSQIQDSYYYNCAYYVNNDDGTYDMLANQFDEEISCPEQGAVSLNGYLANYLSSNGSYYNSEQNYSTADSDAVFSYSNVGAGLAGHYLELITGSSLQDHAAAKLFDPLGMQNTGWTREAIEGSTLAIPHIVIDESPVALPVYELATYPDGGLRSSVSDLARFMAMINNGGELNNVRYLQADSVTLMTEESLPESGYGLFWEIEDELVGHSGSDPGATTYMFFDPSEQTGVVILANGDDEEFDGSAVEDLIAALFTAAEGL